MAESCAAWLDAATSSFKTAQAQVARASAAQQPCGPAIEHFKTSPAPIPKGCANRRLADSGPALLSQLQEKASVWNKRGWQRWEVRPENPLSVEFGKVRDFYLRQLQSGCDTRK